MPLSLAYGAVSGSRRFLYAKRLRRSTRLPRPVIVVGNLTVGGTGKTPLVCWLVARLAERGYRPGIVTRGYGGSFRRGAPGRAPRTIRRWWGMSPSCWRAAPACPWPSGATVPRRRSCWWTAGATSIVSDDGLQHYALARDCEIVVIDGDRRFGNGWLLPAGPLREKRARLDTADAVVVNGGRALLDGAFSMRLEARSAMGLTGGRTRPLPAFAGLEVHAVAGIGHPERFFNMLRAHGIEVIGHALPDHARLTPADVDFRRHEAGAHDGEGCRKMQTRGRRSALVRAGERMFRGRRIDYTARYRDRADCRIGTAAGDRRWISAS